MDLTRRTFVKTTAVALASAAAAGTMATMAGCADGAAKASSAPTTPAGTTRTVGVCRFCGCGCGVIVEAKDGRLVSVTGDPENGSSRGLNCVKGYYLASALYGDDRLTTPLIRDDKATKGTPDGLREATWDEALDLVASKLRETWKADKSRLAFWGSGQQPIVEGYCQAKFWKAGLLSNNIDPNARLCMASAVVGFMNIFQTDEPAGCYADIDEADVFVTWGANMAEAHPMLYSRLTARKLADERVRHYDVTTLRTRTSASADKVLAFKPGADIAIANAIACYLVENDLYDKAFVADHLQFKQGTENIGNAFEDGYDASEQGQSVDAVTSITFEEYAARLAPYTLEYAEEVSGVPADDIRELAEVFADKSRKVLSLWTMGVNQHNRGTWMNHCIYNIHLLTGRYALPGDGAFSLTGQPSACGTAREVGTFCHRLPADLVVAQEPHRRYTEAVWNLPEGYLDAIAKPGFHTVKIFRELSKGNIDFLWSAHNNWAVSLPNLTRFLGRGDKKGVIDAFICVSEVYPTLSTQYADVVLPAAMWVEREGQFGNGERRTAVFEKAVDPPGQAQWDLWMLMEIAKRVLAGEKIGDEDAFEALFGAWYDAEAGEFRGDQREVSRAIWEEYRTFSNPWLNDRAAAINESAALKMEAKQLAPYDLYIDNHGLTWPVREVDGEWLPTLWRFCDGDQADGFDQYGVEQYGEHDKAGGVSFYKSAGKRPSVVFRPWEPPAEVPDEEYPFYLCTGRLLEHWHTGSMTRRVAELDRALPEALLDMNPADCERLGVSDGDRVRVRSRYGSCDIKVSTAGRTAPPEGIVFAPFFAEETLINLVVQDVYCPLSKEPDYKKTTVSIEKI
ncbi:molybdopterin-dependent oxidoreductase [Enterorhabdus sp. P55]|uniref:molybdopterin-dependent oxidoreductase n=1 Tax=Enterorhabdus sp. P55 TaxID=2304571 RepID=UPI001367C81C|nr:molybdopterin-dependent oxidoreductase [Enterorhabdus sp. P55]NBI32969.1 periplasmic nitrate reductase subunit alpha [Enterorhabdus sp. P55]